MCGILGGANYSRKDLQAWMKNTLPFMKGRGPDSMGYKAFNNFYLGATRLRIFDNSNISDQPYYDKDSECYIVFNGAILNYIHLKKELMFEGVNFYSSSDTEVLIKAYTKWGVKKLLAKLKGMFAFAIYDKNKNSVILARDHFGIKPLFFYQGNSFFAFSSIIKPLLLFPDYSIKVNKDVIPEQFAFQCIQPPNTLYHNIYSFLPGEYAVVNLSRNETIRPQKFWSIEDCFEQQVNNSLSDFEELLCDTVSSAWLGDRRKGIQLSGGLDSSLIAAVSRKNIKSEINSYSIIFDGKNKISSKTSEEKYMEIVNKKFNLHSHYLSFQNQDITNLLSEAILVNETPLYSANSVLQFFHASKIKNNVELLLTGEGADDIFLGYYNNKQINSNISSILQMYINKQDLNSLFGKSGYEVATFSRHQIWSDKTYDCLSLEKKLITFTVKTILYGLLSRHDRMFMSNGIEGRPVFCDKDMLQYALNTSVENLYKEKLGKIILRKTAEQYFSNSFINRRKQWLSGPVSDWCANKEIWGDFISTIDLDIINEYMDPALFKSIFEKENSNDKWINRNLTILFSTLNFYTWHSMFIENDFQKLL